MRAQSNGSAVRATIYPDGGAPILAFRERQLRTFDYMLLMPDENGYGALMEIDSKTAIAR